MYLEDKRTTQRLEQTLGQGWRTVLALRDTILHRDNWLYNRRVYHEYGSKIPFFVRSSTSSRIIGPN